MSELIIEHVIDKSICLLTLIHQENHKDTQTLRHFLIRTHHPIFQNIDKWIKFILLLLLERIHSPTPSQSPLLFPVPSYHSPQWGFPTSHPQSPISPTFQTPFITLPFPQSPLTQFTVPAVPSIPTLNKDPTIPTHLDVKIGGIASRTIGGSAAGKSAQIGSSSTWLGVNFFPPIRTLDPVEEKEEEEDEEEEEEDEELCNSTSNFLRWSSVKVNEWSDYIEWWENYDFL